MLNSWQPMHGARDAQYRPSLLDRRGMFDTFFQHACPPPPSSARCLDQPDVSLDRTSARSAPTGCLTRMQAAGAQGGRSTKETHACVSVCVRVRVDVCARARECVCPRGQVEVRFVPLGESGIAGSVPAGGHGKCAGTAAPRTKAPPGL